MEKGLIKKLYENMGKQLRNTLVAGLLALSGVTILKDNVNFVPFEIIEFDNPKKSQYVGGVFPFTKVKGKSEASIRNYGLIWGINTVWDLTEIKGNIFSRGIILKTQNDFNIGTRIEKYNCYVNSSKP